MGAKIMGSVFDYVLTPPQQIVLLAYADHSDHFGRNIYPSKSLIAWKTGYGVRQVQRITDQLLQCGLLKVEAAPAGKPTRYCIDLSNGIKKPEYKERKKGDGVRQDDIRQDVTPDIAMSPYLRHPDVTPTYDMGEAKVYDEPSGKPSDNHIAALPKVITDNVPDYLIPVFTAVAKHIFKLSNFASFTNEEVRRYRAIAQIARTKAGGKDIAAEEVARLVASYARYCNDNGYTPPQAQLKFTSGFGAYIENHKSRIAAPASPLIDDTELENARARSMTRFSHMKQDATHDQH